MEKRFQLYTGEKFLWGETKARKMAMLVNTALDSLGSGDVMIIDLAGIEAMDTTFSLAFFGRLTVMANTEHTGRFVLMENISDCTRDNLQVAMERLGTAVLARGRGMLSLIGKLHPSDIETFTACIASDSGFTAGTLSNRMHVSLTAMNERLAKLTSMGVLRRLRGSSASGRAQYEYYLPS